MRRAKSLLFITGAGVSADSGLPTYRGIGGLYEEAETPEGRPIEEVLSGETMREEPALTWKYIHQIEAACRGSTFNRAHALIAEVEERFTRVWVLTQNVDGLHRKAGSRNVIDIHGDVHDILCPRCSYRENVEDYSALEALPLCPRCSHPLRPDVVLFGELLPSAKVSTMERELERGFDICLYHRHDEPVSLYRAPRTRGGAARQADGRDQPRRDLRLACRLDQARARCR